MHARANIHTQIHTHTHLRAGLVSVLQHDAQAAGGHGLLPLGAHDAADEAPVQLALVGGAHCREAGVAGLCTRAYDKFITYILFIALFSTCVLVLAYVSLFL